MKTNSKIQFIFQILLTCFAAYLAYYFSVEKSDNQWKKENLVNIYKEFSNEAARYKSICEIDSTSITLSNSLQKFYTLFYSQSLQIKNDDKVVRKILKLKDCYDKILINQQCDFCLMEINELIKEVNKKSRTI